MQMEVFPFCTKVIELNAVCIIMLTDKSISQKQTCTVNSLFIHESSVLLHTTHMISKTNRVSYL